MTAMISALVMAATWAGSTYPWGSSQIVSLAAAVVILLIAFHRCRAPGGRAAAAATDLHR
jgi:hypothetical protein